MYKRFSSTIVKRFWIKVNKKTANECWDWTGCLGDKGYGSINKGFWHGGNERAHRLSWIIHYGYISKELQVLHTCDNRKCVNPHHLYLGTNADNVRDRVMRGREGDRSGEKNGRSKLTQKEVDYIRKNYTGKYGNRTKLANKFDVSCNTIWLIVTHKGWTLKKEGIET